MATPVLTIAPVSLPLSAIDLTALTGGSHVDEAVAGFDFSDWTVQRGGYTRCKLDGGGQLHTTLFGGAAYTGDYYFETDFSLVYSDGSINTGGSWDGVLSGSENGCKSMDMSGAAGQGFFYTLSAGQSFSDLTFLAKFSGAFTVVATLSDASVAPVTLTLTGSGVRKGCRVTFTSKDPSATLDLRITRTSTSSDYIAPIVIYRKPSVLPRLPRGGKVFV